jgi:predicted MFS family arabinose efflux permease
LIINNKKKEHAMTLYNKKNKNMYVFLLVMTIITAIGFQGWRSVFNNFAVEVVNMNGQQMGLAQGIREIPGFLALLVVYLLFFVSEHRLAAISLAIMGVGIAAVGFLDSFWGVVLTTLVMSFGFHYYETVNQSLTLQYFDKKTAPLVLARFRSLASLSNIVASGVVMLFAYFLNYTYIFLFLGAVVMCGAVWGIMQDPSSKETVPQHKKMIFKKKYWLFYVLTLLSGSRRQIFVAFAVFLLVQKFEFTIQEIAGLFIVNNIIGYFGSPLIGKAINKFGERAVMSLEYFVLIFVFLAYAYTDSKAVVAIMYVVDNFFFNFAIAIKSYFQKQADAKDIAPSMAVGFTINHVAAVALPIFGGALWLVDYKIPFLLGVALSIVSLIMVQLIKSEAVEKDATVKQAT